MKIAGNRKKFLFSPHRLITSSPSLLAFLLGICATLTLPPFYLFPLVIPAYGGLFFLLGRAATKKEAAKIGFFWGWGFYISGLYWFVIALLTDPDKFAWLIPFALFALTAVIALYTVLFAVMYWCVNVLLFPSTPWGRGRFFLGLRSKHLEKSGEGEDTRSPLPNPLPHAGEGICKAVIFAALWTLVEFARGHLFGGFPWNLGGYVFAGSDASIQLASLAGIYGLTFITVLLGAVCVAHRRAAILCWALLASGIGWGAWRAQSAPHDFVPGITLRLVQANIQQPHKWDPKLQLEGLRAHVELSGSPGIEKVTHIIWPETAVPYAMADHSTLAKRLGLTLRPGQHLITGALRAQGESVTNSIAVINPQGEIAGSYDKHKLVPFGEFLPLRPLIPDWLETPVGMRDMAGGEGAQTLDWPGLPPVSPLICYEVIFPEAAARRDARPAWLLSVTNDAWFGASTGPYQHLAAARMRAVEQGLPMVRAANTGITAVYDAYGREVVRIPLNRKGFVDVELPMPIVNERR